MQIGASRMSAAAAGAAAVIVLKLSSEEKQHMTIIYSRAVQLRPHGGGGFAALTISEVGVYLVENNSSVNLPKGGFLSRCRLCEEERRTVKV